MASVLSANSIREGNAAVTPTKIAIVGGGVSGTFVSRYLADYDQECLLESITLYDPLPVGEYTTKASGINDSSWQGNRVATLKLDDGRLVELGASILSPKFRFVKEMAEAGNLTMGSPFQTGLPEPNMNTGFLIYSGHNHSSFSTANLTSFWKKMSMVWRYNLELFIVVRAMTSFMQKFEDIQARLADFDKTFFTSPQEMWESAGLDSALKISLAEFCRRLCVPDRLPWWRKLLYGQGSLQEELLAGINLVNYNQDNLSINALTGLASFSVVNLPSFSISGGNVQLTKSAWKQAQEKHCLRCPGKCAGVRHVRERVATVVGSLNGFELFETNGSLLGTYDILILATPLSMSRINFLVQSHIDSTVLQPMPLGKLIENSEDPSIPDGHEGHEVLPRSLPHAVSRPYTQVVTTIVRNGTLQTDFFSIDKENVPRGIYMTVMGKASVFNVTAISQVSALAGVYKVFSSEPLPRVALESFFGPWVFVEYEKVWGGFHGGATPDFRGSGESTEFLLFDGALGFHGHTTSGALYYVNAFEHTLSCIETSAMGAKAVAKLIAKRLRWIKPASDGFKLGDEL